MSTIPELLQRPDVGPAPATIELSTANDVDVQVIRAVFDGSGAAGSFLPCVTYRSPSGVILSRTFPGEVSAGDIAEVTFSPFLEQASAAPAPAGTSIPTASLISGNQVISPISAGDHTVLPDMSSATFTTNTTDLARALDGAGFWGIQCPGLKLIRAVAWLEMRDAAPGNADGQHAVGVVRSVSLQSKGPVPDGTTEEAYSLDFTTYVSTIFATAGVQRTEYLQRGSASSFILGVAWLYTAWTVASVDWRFGITCEILGDRLT